jgi:hypothetical protein
LRGQFLNVARPDRLGARDRPDGASSRPAVLDAARRVSVR